MLTRDAVLVQDARYGAVPRVYILGLPHDKSTTLTGVPSLLLGTTANKYRSP